MKISRKEIEAIIEKMGGDYEGICPRCGGRICPENPFPYGAGLSLSRLADISICPECGMKEALTDYEHAEEIKSGDFEKYVAVELEKWHIVSRILHGLNERRYRAIFSDCMESGMYEGKNVDGEETRIFLEQGGGMIIKTCHTAKPRFWECVYFDKDGYQEAVSYEAR